MAAVALVDRDHWMAKSSQGLDVTRAAHRPFCD